MTSVADEAAPSRSRRPRITSLEILCVLLVLALVGQSWISRILDVPAIRTGATVFVAVCTQALPFLVVGVLISGAIAAFVSAGGVGEGLAEGAGPGGGGGGRARRRLPDEDDGRSRWLVFAETARHDLVDAGGFLVIGGLTSAVLNVVVPRSWVNAIGDRIVLGIVVMAVLAVLLALCSEADAFVAASLSALSLLPRLGFLVVGPTIYVKLFSLHVGPFCRAVPVPVAPLSFL